MVDYKFYCHHMTINLGNIINPDYKHLVGTRQKIVIDRYGHTDEQIYAFFGFSENIKLPNPHVTAAIKNGSVFKPKDSNGIRLKFSIDPIAVYGVVTEKTDGFSYCSILLDISSQDLLKQKIDDIIKMHL